MPATFINLTPHPVTIHRPGAEPWTCQPARRGDDQPRGEERSATPEVSRYSVEPGDDTQGSHMTFAALADSGLVDQRELVGISNLPPFDDSDPFAGHSTFYIVSIITALACIAAGRSIVDLVVPTGQMRDQGGRIVGATGLTPASTYLQRVIAAIDRTAP